MNRCEVCNKTDEDDPKANIKTYAAHALADALYPASVCLECYTSINENLEDLSINDEAFEYSDCSFLEDHSVEITLPEVPVK